MCRNAPRNAPDDDLGEEEYDFALVEGSSFDPASSNYYDTSAVQAKLDEGWQLFAVHGIVGGWVVHLQRFNWPGPEPGAETETG